MSLPASNAVRAAPAAICRHALAVWTLRCERVVDSHGRIGPIEALSPASRNQAIRRANQSADMALFCRKTASLGGFSK